MRPGTSCRPLASISSEITATEMNM